MSRRSAYFTASPVLTQHSQGPQKVASTGRRQSINFSCISPLTQYIYDLAGQLTSVTYAFGTADASTTSYTYDAAGRKLTETDARNNTTTYGYDAAGRLTSVKDAVGNITQYGYDGKGHARP